MLCCAKGETGEAVATVIIEYSTKQSDVKPRRASCSQSMRFSKPNGCGLVPLLRIVPGEEPVNDCYSVAVGDFCSCTSIG